jgi:hypothetical protein
LAEHIAGEGNNTGRDAAALQDAIRVVELTWVSLHDGEWRLKKGVARAACNTGASQRQRKP